MIKFNRLGSPFLDLSSLKNTVFIAGTGRSGTTWLSDIVNFREDHRYIFEPFHSEKIKTLGGWKYRQYISPEDKSVEFLIPAEKILKGKIRSKWTDQFNPGRYFFKKRLIKDIRANLFLKWIKVNFPEIKIVFIVRHPFAVAHSKIKLGWGTHLDIFLNQQSLIKEHLSNFKNAIENAKSNFERHIYLWCIENYITFKQFNINEIHLLFYENLCVDFESEVKRLFEFLGIAYDNSVLQTEKKASALSRNDSAIVSGKNPVNLWKSFVNPEEMKAGMRVLALFGFDLLYSDNISPLSASFNEIKNGLKE